MAITGKRKRGGRSTAGQGRRQRARTGSAKRMRVPRSVVPNMLTIKRVVSSNATATFSTTSTSGFWRYCAPSLNSFWTRFSDGTNLGGLTNLSEYTNLFDQFKIHAIKLTFRPRFVDINLGQYTNVTGANFYARPMVAVAYDTSNTIVPTGTWQQATLNTLLEQGNVKFYRADREFSIYLKPKVSEQYGSGAVRYVKPQWTDLDSNGQTMGHRGFHFFVYNNSWDSNMVSSTIFDIVCTYYISFKNMR